jgi:hypothetical protein
MHSDTSPEVERLQLQILRRMTPTQRYERGRAIRRFNLEVMRAGIRHRHSDYTEEQVEMALARLCLGDDLYRKFRPQSPLLEW